MPQVVQADASQARGVGELVEPLCDVGGRHRLSVLAGEDQTVVDVELTPLGSLRLLLEALGHQNAKCGAVEVHHPGVAARCLGRPEAHEAVLSPAELALDTGAVDLDELLAHDNDNVAIRLADLAPNEAAAAAIRDAHNATADYAVFNDVAASVDSNSGSVIFDAAVKTAYATGEANVRQEEPAA